MQQNYFTKNYNKNILSFDTAPSKKKRANIFKNKSLKLYFILAIMIPFGSNVNGQTTTVTSPPGPGTWSMTLPCDVTSIQVQAWGGGGGGYGDNTNDGVVGRGGGGGGYTIGTIAVTPGQVITVIVGAAGTAGSTNGGTGGASSYSIFTANGGGGGTLTAGGSGGTASGGTSNFTGFIGGTGSGSTGGSGGNAGSAGGSGGAGGTIGVNGGNGSNPGGGGGSSGERSGNSRTGGSGGEGRITITYTSNLKTYCNSSFSTVAPITNVTFAGINKTSSASINGTPGSEIFCDDGSVVQGSTTNSISIQGNTNGNLLNNIRVYIDWDQNGVFGNLSNEIIDLPTITNSNGSDGKLSSGNITVPSGAILGKTRLRVIKSNNSITNPCGSYSSGQSEDYVLDVTSSTTPTITSLGSTSGCVGTSITINGTNLAGATASDVKIGGTAVSSITSNSGTVLVAVIGSGTTGTVTVTTTNGTASSSATFTVNQSPTINAGPVLTAICKGGTSTAFGGSFGGAATSAIWSDGGIGGVFANNTGTTPNSATWTPPTTYTGTATLTLTSSGGSCGTTSASKTQVVNTPPTTATVGSNQNINGSLTSTSLGGNTPTSGSGSWTKISGPGTVTFSASSSGTSTATVSLIGTYVFRWTISSSSCPSSSADLTVNYNAPEIDIAGNGNTVFDGNTTPTTTNSTDFGSSTAGIATTKTFTIQNSGNTNLTIGTISFSGANAADYSIGNLPSTTIIAGNSTTFTISFNPSTIGTRTATISILNNDSDENPYDFSIQGTGTIAPLTFGPGGVTSDLQLWLRPDLINGTTNLADNTDVITWNTQGRGSDATKPSAVGAPKYRNNATHNINFNSVVDFTNNYATTPQVYTENDASRQYLKGTSGFYSQDIFVVMIPDVPVTSSLPSMDIFCGDKNNAAQETDATGIGYGNYTSRMSNEVLTYALGTSSGAGIGYGVAQQSTSASYSSAGIINARNNSAATGTELYFNANNIVNLTTDSSLFSNVNDSRFWIGRSEGWDGSLDGRVAEVITYSSRKNDSNERSNIQSYLAIKYGITLGINGTSINYTNSSSNILWDVTANAGYNYDITGIGRDDLSRLNQKQSKSINTAEDITIGLSTIYATNTENINSFDSDKKFLVWGNNRGTLQAQPAVEVNMSAGISGLTSPVSFISVGRTWKVVETGGNVAATKVSIPSAMLTSTITPPGDYLMFISNTPVFNPTAEYRIMTVNGSNLETTYDFNGTKYITFGYAPEKTFVRSISFDGVDDYLDSGKVLNLNTSFTVSAWVKRNSSNKTILSKRNTTFTEGYDLSINTAGKAEMSWMVGTTKYSITSSEVIPLGKWHHIGIIYNSATTTAKIYIDGVTKISNTSMPNIPPTTQSFLIAAADGVNPTSYFNGAIDEVRIWKTALTEAQFRYVMNQEIIKNSVSTNGAVIPNSISLNEISNVPWTALDAYYPMSTYTYTNAKDISGNNNYAALRNLNTVDAQTAPLPYESQANGLWQSPETWLNNTLQDLPFSVSIEDPSKTIDWNIVKTNHNITSEGNKILMGLFVNTNTLNAINDTKIEVSHYLKLDGKIDLEGRSQLIQKEGSDLDASSNGFIERDQQGQSNKFNYNYWSSPVNPINNTANNTNYTVGTILKDGTTGTPANINWVDGYDGSAKSPISLARFWIYKFDNLSNDYANYSQIGETGLLQVGKGFTLKGSGGATATQNLTFVGKPNNGTISNTVGIDQLLLTGNPYPSAIDADAFITDNINSVQRPDDNTIDGTLYFWEHYASNNTHNLAGYQGGYAARNLTGGLAPSSSGVDFISKAGSPSRGIPNKFIPVGQGFFVNGSATGGNVIFKNSQRGFQRETDANSNVLYKTANKKAIHWSDNTNDVIEEDNYKRIRLGFNSHNDFHRQVLIGFMNEKATSKMDYGYDGLNFDDFSNDMYLLNGENQLVIQGEGFFDEDASFPIGVKTDSLGKVSFTIDELENFDNRQNVYIYDKSDDTYHNIKGALYEIQLPEGTINDRFYLRFIDKTLGTDSFNLSKSDEAIVIVNQNVTVQSLNQLIKNIAVYDLSGRKIDSYKKVNAQKFTLSHLNKTTAGLIVKITLDDDTVVSKKIIY